jgi:DcmR-like sensory protein
VEPFRPQMGYGLPGRGSKMPQSERELNTSRLEHALQLFDGRDSLADSVSGFLRDGLGAGDRLLVVMAPANWDAAVSRLRQQGLDASLAVAAGRLTVLDAAATMAAFMRNGSPDRELFEGSVGTLVRALSGQGRLRIYGEMVDLLASEGDFRGALQLEAFWNDLQRRESFILLCGYSAVNFGDPKFTDALRMTCHAHSNVRANPRDVLATLLLEASSQ